MKVHGGVGHASRGDEVRVNHCGGSLSVIPKAALYPFFHIECVAAIVIVLAEFVLVRVLKLHFDSVYFDSP